MASSRRTRRSEPRARPPPRPARGRGAPAPRGEIRLRRARLADAAAVARVMRAAIRALAADACGPARRAAWSSLPPLYHAWAMTAGGERYLVAEAGGRVVGYAARRGPELTAVFVHPRAGRRGVGAALVRRVAREAARAGAGRLLVRAALSAVPFYEALGFAGGRALAVPLPGGETLPSRLLAKRLGPPRRVARPRSGA